MVNDAGSEFGIVGDTPTLVSAICVQVLVSLAFWFAPLILGALASQLHFTSKQLGLVASADLLGMLLGALLALYWIYRIHWHMLLSLLLPLLVLLNISCANTATFEALLLLRLGAGFVAGSIMSVTSTAIGACRFPERNFAIFVGVQGTVAALGLLYLPALIAAQGVAGPYYLLALFAALACLFLRALPDRGQVPSQTLPVTPQQPLFHQRQLLTLTLLVLPGLLFHAGVAASWTYIERLGAAAGLQEQAIANALSVSMIASVIGSAAAVALGMRGGRMLPLTAAIALQAVALYFLAFQLTTTLNFQIGVMGLAFCFNFVIGYQLGLAISMDTSGRVPIAYLIMLKLGMALGPLLSSQFISAGDLRPVLYVSALFYAGSYVHCALLLRSKRVHPTAHMPPATAQS